MDQPDIEKGEKTVISLDGIRQRAADLLENHKGEDLRNNGFHEDFPDREYSGYAVDVFLNQVPNEILNRYFAHGIMRGSIEKQLTAVMAIAEKGLIVGWQGLIAPGKNPVLIQAFRHVSALVVSKIDKTLLKQRNSDRVFFDNDGVFHDDESMFHEVELQGVRKMACEADVGAIILNSELYSLHKELQEMYPNVQFIKANQIPDFFMGSEKEPYSKSPQKLMDMFAKSVRDLLSRLKWEK